MTIPRLELFAADHASKLSAMTFYEMDFLFDRVCFWTDASVVLRYILNSCYRFESFVANRIEKLHTLASTEQ